MPTGFYIEGRRKGEDTQELTIIRDAITNLHHDVTDLETAVSAIDTRAVTIESTLAGVQSEVILVQGRVTDLQAAVSAIDTRAVTIESTLAGVQSEVILVQGRVTDLQAVVSAIDAKISAIESSLAAVTSYIDFWSAQMPKVVITSTAGDPDLPGVGVSGLPPGVGIVRAVAMIKIRAIRDTSGIDNFLRQDAGIAVMITGGTWRVNDIPAINLVNGQWRVIGGVKESGDVMIGNNDIKGVVSGDGVYLFSGHNIASLGNNLELYDVQIGLRVYFRRT